MNVINHLDSSSRPCRQFCKSCTVTRAWSCSQNTFLYTFFYKDSFHKNQKLWKWLKIKKKKNYLSPSFVIKSFFGEDGIFYDLFKLLISYCAKKNYVFIAFPCEFCYIDSSFRKIFLCLLYFVNIRNSFGIK